MDNQKLENQLQMALSLLSSYLDEAAVYGRNVICIGMGNEGSMARHAAGQLRGQRNLENCS